MKKIISFLAILLSIVSVEAFAGQYNGVVIDHISVTNAGVARVYGTGGGMVRETECSQTNSTSTAFFTFDVTSDVGKSWQSMILAALATGKKMHFLGTGNCLSWDGASYEKLRNIYSLK